MSIAIGRRMATAVVVAAAAGAATTACGSDSGGSEIAEPGTQTVVEEAEVGEAVPGDGTELTEQEQEYVGLRPQKSGISDADTVAEGWAVCQALEEGHDYAAVLAEIPHLSTETDKPIAARSSGNVLCPDRLPRLFEIAQEG